ncbi:hypothetical protein QQS21_002099 [Conoideocrella luteorostrata]|uniref:Uncharacterized protein n=1 Tax=Conoideocrella luteorostrata TaxID=1105319 RepID=A0AAJ0FXK8_9HYPO|nr:hypothetical protein QQS21_002099 [Conoideocrella luteorostrata]
MKIRHVSNGIATISIVEESEAYLNYVWIIIFDLHNGSEISRRDFPPEKYDSFVLNDSKFLIFGQFCIREQISICEISRFSLESREWAGQTLVLTGLHGTMVRRDVDFALKGEFVYAVSLVQEARHDAVQPVRYECYRFPVHFTDSRTIRRMDIEWQLGQDNNIGYSSLELGFGKNAGEVIIVENIPALRCPRFTRFITEFCFEEQTSSAAIIPRFSNAQDRSLCDIWPTGLIDAHCNEPEAFPNLSEFNKERAIHGAIRSELSPEIPAQTAWNGTNLIYFDHSSMRKYPNLVLLSYDVANYEKKKKLPGLVGNDENKGAETRSAGRKRRRS